MIRTEDYLREVVTIFFIRKRIILFTTLLVGIVATLISFFWPPVYDASTSVLLKGKRAEKSPETIEQTQLRNFEITRRDLASEVEIITSPEVVGNTIESLRQEKLYFTSPEEQNPATFKKTILDIQQSLQTEILPDSSIVRVSLKGNDPDRTLLILDRLMHEYIAQRTSVFTPEETESFYDKQAKYFDAQLKDVETKLKEMAQKSSSTDPTSEMENNLSIKKELQLQLELARNELIQKKYLLEHLRERLKAKDLQFFSSLDNNLINRLAEKLEDLYIEKGNLLRVYDPVSPVIKAFDEQLEKTTEMLKSEVNTYSKSLLSQVTASEDKITSLMVKLDDLSARNVDLYAQQIDMQRMNRELDLLKYSYDVFCKRREEAKINTGGDANRLFAVSLVNKPFCSGEPVFPKKRSLIPIGLLAGFIAGCSFGFLLEYFDHRFKRPEDVERFAGLTTICSIPLQKKQD